MTSKPVRHQNSQERIKKSRHGRILSRIDPVSSLLRLRQFVTLITIRGKIPDYITAPNAGLILGIGRREVIRALTAPDLVPHAAASNGIRLISVEALQAFILDLFKAWGP